MDAMTTIILETYIAASVPICFDISRSVEVHLSSMNHTAERVVAGRGEGLCQKDDIITWEASHFGIRQQLSVIISRMEYPVFFEDRMTKGAFKSMRHEHHFALKGNGTQMRDVFCYEVPYGIFGRAFNALILKKYMRRLLQQRNAAIKAQAEVGAG